MATRLAASRCDCMAARRCCTNLLYCCTHFHGHSSDRPAATHIAAAVRMRRKRGHSSDRPCATHVSATESESASKGNCEVLRTIGMPSSLDDGPDRLKYSSQTLAFSCRMETATRGGNSQEEEEDGGRGMMWTQRFSQ